MLPVMLVGLTIMVLALFSYYMWQTDQHHQRIKNLESHNEELRTMLARWYASSDQEQDKQALEQFLAVTQFRR